MDPSAYSLKLVTAPAVEPLSKAEVKIDLGVAAAVTAHDAWIDSRIIAARQRCELLTGRQICTATWELNLDRFPTGCNAILLPRAPLQSLTTVSYTDTSGGAQVLAGTVYKTLLNREPAEVALKYGQVWPVALWEPESVVIRFVAGYGVAAAVPELIKAAMYIMLNDWFNKRCGETETPTAAINILRGFEFGEEFLNYAGAGAEGCE